ncbi:Reverse_transcriptase (RNA-dependent DNA polymerase) [Hexamita inflata]|uniref:Reverse_transcriptase (RNA-dependent DNA polymerase) n=1 Tax=Hexamita inflata TaxID=28002 RepID=A0ABP1GUB2_9EUKA
MLFDQFIISRHPYNNNKQYSQQIIQLALDKAYNQLHDDFIRSKIETPSHIDRFIGQFKLKESKPNKHTVFWEEDEQIKIRKLRSAVPGFCSLSHRQGFLKTRRLTMFQGCSSQNKKHWKNLSVSIRIQRTFHPLPAGIVMQGQMEPITEDEIKTIILRIKKAKSPGEDGITGQHLKYLVYQHEPFLKILESFFNQLLNNPRHLQDCKKLFRFRALLIPKKTGGFRPVSCESMILAVFSSCLKTRLMQQIKIHDHQFCFKSGGITHALASRILQSSRKNANSGRLYECVLGY